MLRTMICHPDSPSSQTSPDSPEMERRGSLVFPSTKTHTNTTQNKGHRYTSSSENDELCQRTTYKGRSYSCWCCHGREHNRSKSNSSNSSSGSWSRRRDANNDKTEKINHRSTACSAASSASSQRSIGAAESLASPFILRPTRFPSSTSLKGVQAPVPTISRYLRQSNRKREPLSDDLNNTNIVVDGEGKDSPMATTPTTLDASFRLELELDVHGIRIPSLPSIAISSLSAMVSHHRIQGKEGEYYDRDDSGSQRHQPLHGVRGRSRQGSDEALKYERGYGRAGLRAEEVVDRHHQQRQRAQIRRHERTVSGSDSDMSDL
ncbi:hypothetical protein FA15DRAFT_666531 [Coprinopsis marcescibilis]|uniref:Uncharacterized protein n=1 Tax=Coprinopsis marcescibilis TaxID=230819 RepID=A0A5C3L2J6_COPMA|nr:hypothetical protein FA15DRAFT_666531 [Coprinopsis marcescibilis]